jgi:uncharacterized protein
MLATLSSDEIDGMLYEQHVGRIGCHADGRTYVVPVTYVYDGTAIYVHSAEGLELRLMRANPEVCFEVDHSADMGTWQSVICWGKFEELHGDAARQALGMLVARILPVIGMELGDPLDDIEPDHPPPREPRGSAVVFRIVVRERTGRFERSPSHGPSHGVGHGARQ